MRGTPGQEATRYPNPNTNTILLFQESSCGVADQVTAHAKTPKSQLNTDQYVAGSRLAHLWVNIVKKEDLQWIGNIFITQLNKSRCRNLKLCAGCLHSTLVYISAHPSARAASRSHWPGAANCSQREQQSAEPADAAGGHCSGVHRFKL
ncbi:uncharacterized protein LOC128844939 isoform X3 [Malaclemys terrapin pileata]|uniref:uncharacterized protein LOC128844939 isoform X3 n=1 Tax=Malaclemys terrapin pileata TaxID=2991368 RepID=UPI0023A7A6B1|nr:uncharacterized protein LOC128844939 isoform X3 [Malaclemys terrapin pileata]